MTEQIARHFGITPRRVVQIAKEAGVVRTREEANRLAAPRRHKPIRLPAILRPPRHRVPVPRKVREELITAQPYCSLCGAIETLDIDHIDNNPMNSKRENLQVLCNPCNVKKAHAYRRALASTKVKKANTNATDTGSD